MRQLESDMVQAMKQGRAYGGRNTTVTAPDAENIQRVYLHGHEIATLYRDTSTLCRRLCGYGTVTTRSRLNAMADAFGLEKFCQRRGYQYLGTTMFCEDSDVASGLVVLS